MASLIDAVSHGVPRALPEITTPGRTLKARAAEILAHFDSPGSSDGPTEAINGRLEHLRGSALGFRNHRMSHSTEPRDRQHEKATPRSIAKTPQRPCQEV